MMKSIHVWLGQFQSQTAINEYFAEQHNESAEQPLNQFAADQGQVTYDHDWLEYHFVADADLDDLLFGKYPFGRMALAVQGLSNERGITAPNTLIVADASLIAAPVDVTGQNHRLWFLGKFSKQMSIARFLDPASTPPIADPSEWLAFPSDQQGIDRLRAEAEQGNYNSVAKLHLIYEAGIHTPPDAKKAAQWFRRANFNPKVARACFLANAEAGMAKAWLSLVNLYSGDESIDESERLRCLQNGAEGGVGKCQHYLGNAYSQARYGLARNPSLAEHWLLKAAAAEPADFGICHALYMFYQYEAEPIDPEKSFYWLRQEVYLSGGNAVLGYLARRYQKGEGVEIDPARHLMYLYLSLCQRESLKERVLRSIRRDTEGYDRQMLVQAREHARQWIQAHGASLARFDGERCDPFEPIITGDT